MWWDGIAFFSTQVDHKLPRIIGHKPGWCDKYKSTRNKVKLIMGVVVLSVVLSSQIGRYGKIKSQEVKLMPKSEFVFNSSESMNFMSCFYLDVDQLFDKIQVIE